MGRGSATKSTKSTKEKALRLVAGELAVAPSADQKISWLKEGARHRWMLG
jgi:hypothetical protein